MVMGDACATRCCSRHRCWRRVARRPSLTFDVHAAANLDGAALKLMGLSDCRLLFFSPMDHAFVRYLPHSQLVTLHSPLRKSLERPLKASIQPGKCMQAQIKSLLSLASALYLHRPCPAQSAAPHPCGGPDQGLQHMMPKFCEPAADYDDTSAMVSSSKLEQIT